MLNLYLAVFALFVAGWIGGLVLQHAFLLKVQVEQRPVWELLNRPAASLHNSVALSIPLMWYLWQRGYRSVGDPRFVRFASLVRMYFLSLATLFVLMVVLFTMVMSSVLPLR